MVVNVARIVVSEGDLFECGRTYGKAAIKEIKHNIDAYFRILRLNGYSRRKLHDRAVHDRIHLSDVIDAEIRGMSEGARVRYEDILTYNLYYNSFFLEGCTVLAAIGSASANGNTVFLKNSDKVGSQKLVGSNFYKHKEINVVRIIAPENGNKIIGVGAAGGTGIKLGLNDRGVATGSNLARTKELTTKKVDIRVTGRDQIMREALSQNTAYDAAKMAYEKIFDQPMATPGNLHFADSNEVISVEGSYDRVAMIRIKDDVVTRANSFVLMHDLNDPYDISSLARYMRGAHLMNTNKGKITREMLKQFSMDHENGPGINSICRHGTHFSEETTASAGVMEIDRTNPAGSMIELALGKPCKSWNVPNAHIKLTMRSTESDVPKGFLDGTTWKSMYAEEVEICY